MFAMSCFMGDDAILHGEFKTQPTCAHKTAHQLANHTAEGLNIHCFVCSEVNGLNSHKAQPLRPTPCSQSWQASTPC
jgi:hypothetical protein